MTFFIFKTRPTRAPPTPPLLAWWAGRMGPDAAVRFSSTALAHTVSRERRSRPGRLSPYAFSPQSALITALARPQIGQMNDSTEAEGIDIVVTLDLSISMRALDLDAEDVVTGSMPQSASSRALSKSANLTASTVALPQMPTSSASRSTDWLKRNLQRLELGEIDGSGTAIGTALGASINHLRDHEARSRIVILLTDGESNAGTSSTWRCQAADLRRKSLHHRNWEERARPRPPD